MIHSGVITMKHPFDILPLHNGAGLIFTPCPGTKEVDLKTSLVQLAAAGASAVLTLMQNEEMQRNQVTDLPLLCTQLNLRWFHLPIEDDHAPEQEFHLAWQGASQNIHALLNDGKKIAIHCKGGTGRTGLVAAQILLESGLPLAEVIERVRAVKPNALRIPMQLEYIAKIAQHGSI